MLEYPFIIHQWTLLPAQCSSLNFPYDLLLVSYVHICFQKKALIKYWPGNQSDIAACCRLRYNGRLPRFVLNFKHCHFNLQRAIISDQDFSCQVQNIKKCLPNSHYNLQRAVIPDQITKQNRLQRAWVPTKPLCFSSAWLIGGILFLIVMIGLISWASPGKMNLRQRNRREVQDRTYLF